MAVSGPTADERFELRRSFRCSCEGETWSPLRVIRSDRLRHGDDPGESSFDICEEASGVRPIECPWSAMRDPFIAEVIRAHAWRELGQLEVKYPRGVPSRVVWAVEMYAVALNSVRVFDMREAEKRRAEANPPKP